MSHRFKNIKLSAINNIKTPSCCRIVREIRINYLSLVSLSSSSYMPLLNHVLCIDALKSASVE